MNFFNYANYYHIRPVIERKEEFLKQLEASDGEESTLSLIHEDFGLSFETAMEHRNRLDNDLLYLLIDFPELVESSDEEILQVITHGIDMGFSSGDDDWLLVEEDIRQGINGLTVGEVWDCMKKAIGFGSASILSLSALKELASKKGIQEVVKTVSVALAKKAGWIGAAVTLFEFSTCIYNEYKD